VRAGVNPDRIDVVPSGVPLPAQDPFSGPPPAPGLRAILDIPVDSFVVLTAGRLEPLKGQRTFVEACAFAGDLGNTRWVVAGEGPDRLFLERLAGSLNVADRVVFAGQVADLPAHLRESQVFVLASFREALGTALLDAMAAGVPVIAADGEGAAEILEQDVDGRLVPVGDARSVAEAVRVLYLDPSRRRELGARGCRRAQAFSLDATVEGTLASYRTALGRADARREASPAAGV
jgi:glycosyltransferase involved in cell wall biosynthesis